MIRVTCEGAARLTLDQLEEFQGDLKTLSDKNAEKLEKSIRKYGFTAPFFVWKGKILDGHQRKKVLRKRFRPEEYPEKGFPVVYIDAGSEKEAREKLLHISSQYGEVDLDELNEWVEQAGHEIIDSLRLTKNEIRISQEDDPTYSGKIEAPIYEPTGKCPKIKELMDTTRSRAIIEKINEEENLDADLREFLIHAAHRHTVFNYRNIAEYYAHAGADIQNLFEDSALVIIDFDQAIEQGFVKFRDKVIAMREEDRFVEQYSGE